MQDRGYLLASSYYGFDPEAAPLPYFPDLVAHLPEGDELEKEESAKSVEDARPWIASFAPPIRSLCSDLGYEAIIADLTVFQDERRLVDPGKPYVVNCVMCYRERADKFLPVMNAYMNALEQMAGRPIVPQEAFYDVLYLCRELSLPRQKTRVVAKGQSAFRRRTYYEASSGGDTPLKVKDLPGALARLGTNFVTNVGGNLSASGAPPLLLAVPFHRATYRPVIVRSSAAGGQQNGFHRHPSAGGGLFLVLERKKARRAREREHITRLAAALRYLLTLATLTESATNLEIQDRAVSMLGNMIHGTVTSIRAVSSTNLWSALSDDLQELSSLRYELMREGVRDVVAEEMVLNAARIVRLGEETAAAMLALAEISVHRGVVLMKHTSPVAHTAVTLLREACAMVNGLAHQEASGSIAELVVDLKGLPTHSFPAGYLDHRIIRGLILEILKNSALHAKRPDGHSVPVSITMTFMPSDGGNLAISMRSPVEDFEWVREDGIAVPKEGRRRPSFLIRLAEFCRDCPGVAITTEAARGSYVTTLTFSRVAVLQRDGSHKYFNPVEA